MYTLSLLYTFFTALSLFNLCCDYFLLKENGTPHYTSSHYTTPYYNLPLSDAVMDALNMPSIPDHCFDLIIDKALLDAQLCTPHNIDNASALVQEMYRVLAPGDSLLLLYSVVMCLLLSCYYTIIYSSFLFFSSLKFYSIWHISWLVSPCLYLTIIHCRAVTYCRRCIHRNITWRPRYSVTVSYTAIRYK